VYLANIYSNWIFSNYKNLPESESELVEMPSESYDSARTSPSCDYLANLSTIIVYKDKTCFLFLGTSLLHNGITLVLYLKRA